MMRCEQTHGRGRAFTLVELLVVIGIVTVLIAVLLPVLGRAREQANRVKCGANLRSIGQALTMYTQQYHYYPGMMVQAIDGATGEGAAAAVWVPRLRPFLGGEKGAFLCPSRDERFAWSDTGPQPVERAVLGTRFVEVGYAAGEPMVHVRAYFSYGYNGYGCPGNGAVGSVMDGTHKGLGDHLSITNRRNIRELPASRVKVPEDMVAVTDSNGNGLWDYGSIPHASGSHGVPGRVHGGGANVLFCDGHVTWYRQEDLLVADDARRDPGQWHRIRRWNNDHGIGD
jgi:prepilin-type processing-associated H-X9-DG protein